MIQCKQNCTTRTNSTTTAKMTIEENNENHEQGNGGHEFDNGSTHDQNSIGDKQWLYKIEKEHKLKKKFVLTKVKAET